MAGKKFVLAVGLLKLFIHSCCLLPIFYIYGLAFSDQLGADPVDAVIHFTGLGALNILLASLLISPLAKFFKQGKLLQVRRLIGLYAFTYALLHLLNFLFFEVQFNLQLFFDEILDRPYITVGMISFILLFTLAITSINQIKKRMGSHWQKLHNVTYFIGILIIVHFYWSVKSDVTEPLIYLLLLVALLSLRKDKFIRWFK